MTPDEPLECFICREQEVTDQDSLQQYCDCKSLAAHHKCLLTWIQKDHRNEAKPRCKVCMAEMWPRFLVSWTKIVERVTERDDHRQNQTQRFSVMRSREYHLENSSAWKLVAVRWQNWMILGLILGLMVMVLFIVYWMMTAFSNPPPHFLFKAASICFGLISEMLLIRLLLHCCSSRYSRAKISSFSVMGRSLEEGDRGPNLLSLPGQNPPVAASSRVENDKTLDLGLYV
ncbi:uncharacterized protein LOC132401721 isoform X1 [Hypanus sabinus]|uniref:uncharacterized protein LOC132401721 isoform X1 n=1 Tax=Hypanus sabinus TaxID=79690 RepID=UPI0028C42549|nr:uncharacterized protein LOC132401721 isoform X1 [Hypanus sabinus]